MLLNNQTREVLFIQTDDIVLCLFLVTFPFVLLSPITHINGSCKWNTKVWGLAKRLIINWNLLSLEIIFQGLHITVFSMTLRCFLSGLIVLEDSLFNIELQILFSSEVFPKMNIFSFGKVVLFCWLYCSVSQRVNTERLVHLSVINVSENQVLFSFLLFRQVRLFMNHVNLLIIKNFNFNKPVLH